MTHDPLEALLRLRRMAADEARRGLAECLRVESEAAAAVAAIEASIERETEVATSLAAGDAEVEAFAAWLRRIRPKQHAALAAEEEAATATVRRARYSARHGQPCGRRRRCWRSTPPLPAQRRAQGAGRDRRGGAALQVTPRGSASGLRQAPGAWNPSLWRIRVCTNRPKG